MYYVYDLFTCIVLYNVCVCVYIYIYIYIKQTFVLMLNFPKYFRENQIRQSLFSYPNFPAGINLCCLQQIPLNL